MGSQWVDATGVLWRFSEGTKTWQKMVGNRWVSGQPPTGGLRRQTGPAPEVIVVNDRGPRGPKGDPGPPGPPGTSVRISEVLSAEWQNGVNSTFPLANDADLSQPFQVFRNGLMEIPGHGYQVTPTHVTFTTPPLDSDVIAVVYQKAQ